MFKAITLALALSACATAGVPGTGHDAAPRTGVRLDLSVSPDDASPVFPAAIDPRVPAIDHMAPALHARAGTVLTAELDLCVAPDGHVTKIGIAKGSSSEAFDHALVRDAADWQFTQLPGPLNVEACRRATIAYRTR